MSKKKVIAVTEIHRTLEPGKPGDKSKGLRPTPPKVQIIKAGTVFNVDTALDDDGNSEYKSLLASEAIRVPAADEKVSVNLSDVDVEDDPDAVEAAARQAASAKKKRDEAALAVSQPKAAAAAARKTATAAEKEAAVEAKAAEDADKAAKEAAAAAAGSSGSGDDNENLV